MKINSAHTSIMSLVALSGMADAYGQRPPPAEYLENFNWQNPFSSDAISPFQAACEATSKFEAREYTLLTLLEPQPEGLKPWVKGLKEVFTGREYPGSWSGLDRHQDGRSLLLMDYHKLPLLVRNWIEEQERTEGEGKGLFAVFERPESESEEIEHVVVIPSIDKVDRTKDESRVVIFAPGAIYAILPLWVAEDSKCKDDLAQLSKYKPTPSDGGVVAWVEHSEPEEKSITIEIKAQVLKSSGDKTEDKKSNSESAKVEL